MIQRLHEEERRKEATCERLISMNSARLLDHLIFSPLLFVRHDDVMVITLPAVFRGGAQTQ